MREIKFRAWDKEKKEMIYDNNLAGMPNMMTFNGWVYKNGKLQPYIMLQYSGLKDKNGKEIYEGDIIHFFHLGTKRIGIIKYADKWASFYIGTKNKYKINIAVTSVHSWYYREEDENTLVEIIGNIWESKTIAKEG